MLRCNGETSALNETTLDCDSLLPPRAVSLDRFSGITTRIPAASASRVREETKERLSDSTLAAFLTIDWPISALGLLFRFASHISLHIGEIFASDRGSSQTLSSSLNECIELLLRQSHCHVALVPSWSRGDLKAPADANLSFLEKVAIDLLHGEQLLTRVEKRLETQSFSFDSEPSKLSLLVSTLCQSLQNTDLMLQSGTQHVSSLKVRIYWMTTRYLLWKCRSTRNVSESRSAEGEALKYLKFTIEILDMVGEVATPHLESEAEASYCKVLTAQSLEVFYNEITASSVILSTQEACLEAISNIIRNNLSGSDSARVFLDVGQALLERYHGTGEVLDEKLHEIVDDFLRLHGNTLIRSRMELTDIISLKDWFDSLVLSSSVDSTVLQGLSSCASISILSIMSCCLVAQKETSALLKLYSRLIIAICIYCRSKLSQGRSNCKKISLDDTDDESFNKSAGTSFSSVTEGLRKHMTLLQLLLGKIHAIAITEENEQLFFTFVASEICIHMVQLSLCLCADWFVYSLNQPPYAVDGPQDDVDLLNSVMTFLKTIQLHPQLLGTLRQSVVRGAANIIIKQTSVLRAIVNHEQGPTGQFLRQRLGKSRATLLAKACCMLGQELSDIIVTKSGSFDPDVLNDHDSLSTMLAEVCESLLCLWETALINELNLKARLMVPVATAIVGLCGFSGDSGARASNTHAATSATDIFDSDTSAAQLISETSSADAEIVAARQGKNLLCLLGQMVQAINGVFSAIDEEEAVSIKHYEGSTTKNGPLLPLVVARVLNWIADKLLIAFADGDDSTRQKAIWNDYPFGTRTIGALLDRLLYKAYKCLHRVILTNNNEIKDVVAPSCSPLKVHQYKPENLNAAIALYRCIMRAYSQGRKSPPKAALDVILDALPPLSSEDGAQRDDIQTYLFSRQSCNPLSEVRAIINRSEYWELPFTKVRNVFNKNGTRESEDEATSIVRRGISQLLAQGALPEQANDCDRAESIRIEEELSKKFNAILESLWLGDASDFRGWYKAAQCIVEKANLIADRIGPSRSDNHNSCFTVPERPVALGRRRRLPELLQEHENESNYKGEGWVSSIGANLSLYTRYIWSSFASLQACSAEAAAFYRDPCIDDNETNERLLCLKLSCIENEDVSNWQQTWGGLFVASLRIIATRCICLALYILAQDTDVSNNESKQMLSECMECLGVVMYSELSGCQRYGCPMSALTSKRKRDLAEVALECFARADAALTHDGDIRLHKYGLRFMQGKCHEKIANTFRNESFSGTISGPDTIRRYEVHMKTALLEYAYSLEVSLAVEKGGLLNAEQNGGSDHGSAEVLYRLHALRLKCLIYGVNHQEGERYLAETEALRLTEMNFYSDPVHRQSGVRERVWTVLTDVVDALARCRLDFSYFHRSVYRHAQALLWAPVLDNPIDQWCRGSAGTVSASKAAKLRGFNSSNAYSSAATVLSVLFEKRRPQLCAVWVTTGSASPFAVLNQTVRKYDRLRGKYILAYLNLLRLCSRRDDIETLMKFFYGAGRDLPSFFAASAKAQGGAPQVHHSSDRLLPTRSLSSHFFLTTVKRHANGCLAQLIVQDVQAGKLLSEFAKERSLKTAYSCFLRLNCSEEALAKCFRLWTIHHMFDPIKAVALSLIETYAQFSNGPLIHDQLADWNGDSRQTSLLRSSLNHSKKLFPNLSGNYYSRKPIQKRKRKASDISMDKSFDIKVPEGSKTGDSFVVTVEVDGQGRKVRLTVPDPVPAIMRFCLPGAIKDPQMDNTSDAKKSIT
ncbi:hypothetical protein MPSEU_000495500 [Mayamaea pseudoterrestris]|nr:hypothetical protein MPSEU_000495500 [Mayamaea pseudoterrestris]